MIGPSPEFFYNKIKLWIVLQEIFFNLLLGLVIEVASVDQTAKLMGQREMLLGTHWGTH